MTTWLVQLREGDRDAVRKLWENYYQRLVRLAAAKLQGLPRGVADEEDVALSAFDSFCRAAEQGRFPNLADREGLWEMLMLITARKAGKLIRDEGRAKRDWRRTVPLAGDEPALLGLIGGEPDPAFAAEVAEGCRFLLGLLDDQQRAVARLKLEGYTNAEIAQRLDVAPATVERRLRVIRAIWEAEDGGK